VPDLSISVRLRRVRTETATVSVPITERLIRPNEDGEGTRPDVDKIIAAALALANHDSIVWEPEGEPEIRLHPVQASPSPKPN
jgi:hypothetical protein